MTVRAVMVSDASRAWAHALDDLRERWNIRKEPPTTASWMPVALFEEDIARIDRTSLLALKGRLGIILADVKASIEEMQSFHAAIGEYAPVSIYREATRARRSIGAHIGLVDAELRGKPRQRALAESFMDTASRVLAPEVFASVLEEALASLVKQPFAVSETQKTRAKKRRRLARAKAHLYD